MQFAVAFWVLLIVTVDVLPLLHGGVRFLSGFFFNSDQHILLYLLMVNFCYHIINCFSIIGKLTCSFIVIFIVINFSSETFFRPVNYVHYAIRICFFSECYHLKVICKDNSNVNFFSNSSNLLRLQRESCSCNIEFSVSKKLQKTFLVLTCTLKT